MEHYKKRILRREQFHCTDAALLLLNKYNQLVAIGDENQLTNDQANRLEAMKDKLRYAIHDLSKTSQEEIDRYASEEDQEKVSFSSLAFFAAFILLAIWSVFELIIFLYRAAVLVGA